MRNQRIGTIGTIGLAPLMCMAGMIATAAAGDGREDICALTATLQRWAAQSEIRDDFAVELAGCHNLSDQVERTMCLVEAIGGYAERFEEVEEIYEARMELCVELGPDAYDPFIDPEEFTYEITNPLMPFPIGAEWTYEAETEDGLETIVVTVLPETREILGVECIAVRDTVTLKGEFIEDTIDWYAQDSDGNVWYFGEVSLNFEDGFISDIDGSWLAGVDGAKPGIVMHAAPTAGQAYRQEYLLGDAEDAAIVLNTDVFVEIKIGSFDHCLQTMDFTPIDPGVIEHKFYAPGIGFIREVKLDDEDEVLELVSYEGL